MTCGISDAQWIDYLDRTASGHERRRIESHLGACRDCRSHVDLLREIDQRLRIESGLLRQAIHVPAGARTAAQASILAALKKAGTACDASGGALERLWRVRWVLSLLCGSNTAMRIIQAAESNANVSAPTKTSEQKWLVFLRRLAFITTEVCGSFAGELIWAVGK